MEVEEEERMGGTMKVQCEPSLLAPQVQFELKLLAPQVQRGLSYPSLAQPSDPCILNIEPS